MALAKRQRKEKLLKWNKGKVCWPEWAPQVKQTSLLPSPVYTGQAQEEEKKHIKRGVKTEPPALSVSFGLAYPHTSRMYFPLLAK